MSYKKIVRVKKVYTDIEECLIYVNEGDFRLVDTITEALERTCFVIGKIGGKTIALGYPQSGAKRLRINKNKAGDYVFVAWEEVGTKTYKPSYYRIVSMKKIPNIIKINAPIRPFNNELIDALNDKSGDCYFVIKGAVLQTMKAFKTDEILSVETGVAYPESFVYVLHKNGRYIQVKNALNLYRFKVYDNDGGIFLLEGGIKVLPTWYSKKSEWRMYLPHA